MRNLKRALSLTLASVMLLGMMAIGSSAASYPDVDQEDNVEAIEVLQAVKVMQGDDKGNFDPDREVSRNEMAIIMANLLNLDYDYYQNTCPFWDVPDYAKPYVAACYANGIVSGYNATTYGGADTVTAVQAASMMMRALGYFQHQEDYEGDFVLSTVKQASRISLFDGINSQNDAPLTRNQVARLALNALEARMVDFDGDLGIDLPNYGVVGYNSKYEFRTGTQSKYNTIAEDGRSSTLGVEGQYYVQLGEQLYDGDLKKTITTDDFGAPATRWTYKNSEIGVYADEADYVFEGIVKSNAMYSAVGKTAAEQYQWIVKMDGVSGSDRLHSVFDDDKLELFARKAVEDNDSQDLAGTKRGSTTYVYLNETNQDGYRGTAIVCIVNTYAAEVTRVSGETITLDDMDKPGLEFDINGYSEDDVVLYTKAANNSGEWTVESILGEAELVEGKVDGVRVDDRVIIGSNTYRYNYRFNDDKGSMLDTDSVNENVAFYLDRQGHIVRMADADVSNDYAYVYSVGAAGNKYGSDAEYGAKLILTDGSTMNVDIDSDTTDKWTKGVPGTSDDKLIALMYGKTNATTAAPSSAPVSVTAGVKSYPMAPLVGQIVSYSQDKSGAYTLTTRTSDYATWGTATDDVIRSGQSRIALPGGYLYADENSAILVNIDGDDGDDYNAYKGYASAPTVDANIGSALTAYVRNGVVKALYITDTDSTGSSENVIFIKGDKNAKENRIGSDYYRVYSAVIDGEVQDVRIKEDSEAGNVMGAIPTNDIGIYFGYNEDSNGLITKLTTALPKDVSVNYHNEGSDTCTNGYHYGTNDDNLWHGARWNAPGAVGLMAFNWDGTEYKVTPGRNADALIVYANTNHDLRVENTLLSDRNDEVLVVRDDGVVIAVFVQEIPGAAESSNGSGAGSGSGSVIKNDIVEAFGKGMSVDVKTDDDGSSTITVSGSNIDATVDEGQVAEMRRLFGNTNVGEDGVMKAGYGIMTVDVLANVKKAPYYKIVQTNPVLDELFRGQDNITGNTKTKTYSYGDLTDGLSFILGNKKNVTLTVTPVADADATVLAGDTVIITVKNNATFATPEKVSTGSGVDNALADTNTKEVEIAENKTVTTTATTIEKPVTVSEGATLNLNTSSTTTVEGPISVEKNATLKATKDVTIKDTITVSGTMEVGANVKTADGGKIVLEEGAVLKVTENSSELPKIEGKGTVEIADGKKLSTVGTPTTAEHYLNDLMAKVNVAEKKLGTGTTDETTKATTYNVAINAGTAFKGGGKIESYSGSLTLAQIASFSGGGTTSAVSFHKVSITKDQLVGENGCKIQIKYTTDGTTYANLSEVNGETPFGGGDGDTVNKSAITDLGENETLDIILPLCTNVTGLQVIITPTAAPSGGQGGGQQSE